MSCGSISAQLLVLKQSSDTPASVMFLIRESLLGDGCCCSACITSEQEPGNRPRNGETVAKRRISGETHSFLRFCSRPARSGSRHATAPGVRNPVRDNGLVNSTGHLPKSRNGCSRGRQINVVLDISC